MKNVGMSKRKTENSKFMNVLKIRSVNMLRFY